jgi:hypothetical protein
MEKEKGNCCVCGKETDLYCKSCEYDWGERNPTYFCEEHYQTTVMTGNCCSANEKLYAR